jgi:hypothetical protein
MTLLNERSAVAQPHLSDTLFEEIARLALHEDARLEFINGKMREKPAADGDHDTRSPTVHATRPSTGARSASRSTSRLR